MEEKRVVITGIGVVAPNGTGISEFENNLRKETSAIRKIDVLEELTFGCQIAAIPKISEPALEDILPPPLLNKLENEAIKYACLAASEAWEHAGFPKNNKQENPNWDAGVIFGCGALGMDSFIYSKMKLVMAGKSRKVGSRIVEQCMNSGAVTYLNEIIGFGNVVTSNSSACATGTEAVIQGYERIKSGKARVMLCGSCESQGPLIWGAFDGMRILCSDSNGSPENGSRPLSENPKGFVPGTGAGALVLEDLVSAKARNATIYAEIVAGDVVNGGHRNGGSVTASNPTATQRCIRNTINEAGISGSDIDLICGHFTSTSGDIKELDNWAQALDLRPDQMPYLNTIKSMIGHCIGAAGSIELVACVLQLSQSFIHGSCNLEKVHPDVEKVIESSKIIKKTIEHSLNYIIKASFGFGDTNSCVILKKWSENG